MTEVTGGSAAAGLDPASQPLGSKMLKRSLTVFALIAFATVAASAREPVVIKTRATTEKDQSRIVADPSLKPQKFSDYVAAEKR